MEDKGNLEVFMGMSLEDLKRETSKLTDLEIIKSIENCRFECEAGPLENNVDWIILKERIKNREISLKEPIKECKKLSYVDRMKIERKELNDKLFNLKKFKETEFFKGLNDFQKEQLFIQCHLMEQYYETLNNRIKYESSISK